MSEEITYTIEPRHRPGTAHLCILCERAADGLCRFPLSTEGPSGATPTTRVWHWDGNREKPTLHPSIDCQGGCQRHFSVIGGVIVR